LDSLAHCPSFCLASHPWLLAYRWHEPPAGQRPIGFHGTSSATGCHDGDGCNGSIADCESRVISQGRDFRHSSWRTAFLPIGVTRKDGLALRVSMLAPGNSAPVDATSPSAGGLS